MYPHGTKRSRETSPLISLPPGRANDGSANCLFTRWFTAAYMLGSSGALYASPVCVASDMPSVTPIATAYKSAMEARMRRGLMFKHVFF